MNSFIHGVLVQNKDGATYEGEVYDRQLQLQLAQGLAWQPAVRAGPSPDGGHFLRKLRKANKLIKIATRSQPH